MSFDFTQAIKEAQTDLTNKSLFLLLLGQSGSGKSYAQGTYGLKTLYLYTQGENHGPASAATLGGANAVPVCIDRVGGAVLSPEDSLARLDTILDDITSIKKHGFQAIAIDGATEIEALIRGTAKFKVISAKNSFEEGPATLLVFRGILNKLKKLQRETGIHVCMTCALTVREYGEDNAIIDSTPQLVGFQVATGLVQQFGDVLVVGRMVKNDKSAHRFQLMAGVNKTTKDFKTKEVTKTFNFSPRITGTDITALPRTLDANLAGIIAIKEGKAVKPTTTDEE